VRSEKKKAFVRGAILVAGWTGIGLVMAVQAQHNQKPVTAAVLEPPGRQTTCPVTGEPVKAGVSTVYAGRAVGFCCKECVGKFEKNSRKYLPALYRQLYPQQVQVTCPVMGNEIDPLVFTDYKGQKVFFCCKGCDKKFDANPAKYLPKLKKSYTRRVHCPVTGNAISPVVSLEENGRSIYFCCKSCIRKYQAEPGRYADALRPEVGVLAYGATLQEDIVRCPVCPADSAEYRRVDVKTAVHEGKVYFLSSDACLKEFNANPARYAKLPEGPG